MHRSLIFNKEDLIKLLVLLFLLSMILKIGLASLLWAPRAFTFEDLVDNIYNVDSDVYISQILTVIICMTGALNFLLVFDKICRADSFTKKYIFFYIVFYVLSLISVVRSETKINLEMMSILFTPTVLFSLVYYKFDLTEFFIVTLTIILAGCLVSALVNPEWAYVLDYESDLAIFDKRFAGILSHPNVTGVVSIMCLIFALARRNSYAIFSIFVSITSLILSQSKTNWIACLFILALYFTRRFVTRKFATVVFTLIAIPAIFFPFFYLSIYEFLPNEPIYTLTGRVAIWEEAVNYYWNSPIFGFGGDAWGVAFREMTELTGANHAHNQILETLSTQGTLGLIALLTLFSMLFKSFGNCLKTENGFIFSAFLCYVVLRGISEPSISHHNVTIVLFTMLVVSHYGLLLRREYNGK